MALTHLPVKTTSPLPKKTHLRKLSLIANGRYPQTASDYHESNPFCRRGRDMKLQTMIVRRSSLLLVAGVLAFSGVRAGAQTLPDSTSAAQAPAVAARITQA